MKAEFQDQKDEMILFQSEPLPEYNEDIEDIEKNID